MTESAETAKRTDLEALTSEWFLFLTTFRRNVEAMPGDVSWVRRKLNSLLDQMDRESLRDPKLHQQFGEVKYPLVYFADEVLLNSWWAGEPEWASELLEDNRFLTRQGGKDFFIRMQAPDLQDPEILNIYLKCLSLGFRGHFVRKPLQLREARERLLARLNLGRPSGHRFCPDSYLHTDARDFVKLPAVATAKIAACTLAVIISAWIVGKISFGESLSDLWNEANQIVEEGTGNGG